MSDVDPRDDLAFIRRTLEEGRNYAQGRSPDFLIWGTAEAIGYLATYAFVRGWILIDPNWIWLACIALPWLYSLRYLPGRLSGKGGTRPRSPMRQAMGALWLGGGIFLTVLGFGSEWLDVANHGWFNVVVAGVMGIGFFTSATLCNLSWMRVIALCWWMGALLLLWLHERPAQWPVAAALMLLFLAGPGLVLLLRGRASA
jgi:hypothetical protein